jgi:DNA-binding NtrC family response regulator
MQTRFLRALETGEYTPVGGRETRRGDIRLVAASNRDLGREVEAGRFRQDLYYRLRVVVIVAPPLRERAEDVPLLASAFLAEENREHGLAIKGIARAAMQMLEVYAWPGNVRELRNVIRSAAVLKQTGLIEAEDLPDEIRRERFRPDPRALPVPVPRDRESLERELLTTTLLELREDIKEIKEMLRGRVPPAWSGGSIPVGEGMVETYHGDAGYSPVGGEGGDLQTAERTLIEAALKATGGRRKAAAERLGISERTLYRKIKKYGL